MRNRNAMLFGAGALFLGLVAFVTAYVLRPGDAILTAQAPLEPPGPEALPTPGATPDPAQPFWYVPYVNADSKLPHFVGKLGPFTVNPGDPGYTAYDVCPAVGMDLVPPGELDRAVRTPGPFSIDLVRLDAGITQVQLPNAWRCKGTSALRDVHWMLHIRAGTPDVDKGGHPSPSIAWQVSSP